eukprot:scaffold69843_cov28-Phaeocystis_antarctica.AAC.1
MASRVRPHAKASGAPVMSSITWRQFGREGGSREQRHQYPRDQSAWRVLGRLVRRPEKASAQGPQCAGLSCCSWRVLD